MNIEEIKKNISLNNLVSVEELGLTVRVNDLLKKAGLFSVQAVASSNKRFLIGVKGLGMKALKDIVKSVEVLGLKIEKEPVFKIVNPRDSEMMKAFHVGMQQAKEESRPERKKVVYPSADVTPPEKEKKFNSALEIASNLEQSMEYLARRQIDCNQLCADILLGRVDYCRIREHEESDNFSFSTVVSTTSAKTVFFASPHKECCLAFVLATWW